MKIGVLQFQPKFGKVEMNVNRAEEFLITKSWDLAVLPELFNTGYQFIDRKELEHQAELIPNGYTTERLIRIAQRQQGYIVAGIAEKATEGFYNSAVLIGPQGYLGHYRKVHLFYEEKLWFQPGDKGFRVYNIGMAKIGLMICFDWIFPEVARTLALQGADILCQPANLVLPYCPDAMITRAIENRVFTMTANRIGTEKRGDRNELHFIGQSQIVDPKGNLLFRLKADTEELKVIKIDPAAARDKWLTTHNHIFKDRRPEVYALE